MNTLKVKTGDTVLVITGKDKDKRAKVLAVSPEKNKVVVEGVNIVSKCKKARSAQEKSTIQKIEAPIDASNVMVVCPKCDKATRVAHKVVDGKKVRVCKHCGAVLDVKVEKETKKAVKEEKTTTKTTAKKTTAKKTTTKKTAKADK
ncbi:MAG: 50S ribosomal protein L24 [Clostridia bacterium]|nr:50S ribosomal protein L24 [Clostridia bacterium]